MPAFYPQPYTATQQLDDLVYGASDYPNPNQVMPAAGIASGYSSMATPASAAEPAAQYPPTSPPPAGANYVAEPAPAMGPDPFAQDADAVDVGWHEAQTLPFDPNASPIEPNPGPYTGPSYLNPVGTISEMPAQRGFGGQTLQGLGGRQVEPATYPPTEPVVTHLPRTGNPLMGYATEPQGGNDSVSRVPSSQGYGTSFYVNDPAATPAPYQPAQPAPVNGWGLPTLDFLSPLGAVKDGGQPADYPPTEPGVLPTPGIASGWSSPYAGEWAPVATTAEPNANTDGGESIPDMLARSAGLNVNDPDNSLYQQFVNSLYRYGGDVAGRTTRTGADIGGFLAKDQLGFFTDAAGRLMQDSGLLEDQARFYGDAARRLGETGRNLANLGWDAGEAVIGPHGTGLRQIQSTADPWGQAIAENVIDPLGAAKDDFFGYAGDSLNLRGLSESAADFFNRGGERAQELIDGRGNAGDALLDVLNFPMPSFGLPTPGQRDIDLTHPDWTWGISPGGVASQAGFRAGEWMRDRLDQATGVVDQAAETAAAQRARGAAIAARAQGGSPTEAATAAANELIRSARERFPDTRIETSQVRDLLNTARSAMGDREIPFLQGRNVQPGERAWWSQAIAAVTGLMPSNAPATVPSVGNGSAPFTLRRGDPNAMAGGERTATDTSPSREPSLWDSARTTAGRVITGAENWADANLPGQQDIANSGAGQAASPLIDQGRAVAGKAGRWIEDRAPDVDLPGVDLPDAGVTLPSGIVLPRGVNLPDMPWQEQSPADDAARNAVTWTQNAVRGWEHEARNRPTPRAFPARPAFVLEADGSLVASERTSDAFAAGTGLNDYPPVGVLSIEPDGSVALNSTMISPAALEAAAGRGEYVAALSNEEFDAILAAGLMRNPDGSPLTPEDEATWRANMVGIPMLAPASWAPYIAGVPGSPAPASDVTYTLADQPAVAAANTATGSTWNGGYPGGNGASGGYRSGGYSRGGGSSRGGGGGGGSWYDDGGSYPPTMPASMADFFGPDAFDSPIFDRMRGMGMFGSRRRGRRGRRRMPMTGRGEMPSRDVNLRVQGPVVNAGSAGDEALARALALRNRREV